MLYFIAAREKVDQSLIMPLNNKDNNQLYLKIFDQYKNKGNKIHIEKPYSSRKIFTN